MLQDPLIRDRLRECVYLFVFKGEENKLNAGVRVIFTLPFAADSEELRQFKQPKRFVLSLSR